MNRGRAMPQKKTRKLAVCQLTFDPKHTFQEDVDEIARHGIPGITIIGAKLEAVGFEKGRRMVRDAGLKVAGYHASAGWFGQGDFQARVEESKRRIEEAARLESDFQLVKAGPRGATSYAEAASLFREGLAQIAPFARQRKVDLALEPSHPMFPWNSFVHTLHDTLDLVRDFEGVGALLDTWHVWWDPRLLEDIRRDGRLIYNVQINDYARPAGPANILIGGPREVPGRGLIPLAEILHAVDATGYDRWYDIEVIDEFPPERRKTLVGESKAWFERVWG